MWFPLVSLCVCVCVRKWSGFCVRKWSGFFVYRWSGFCVYRWFFSHLKFFFCLMQIAFFRWCEYLEILERSINLQGNYFFYPNQFFFWCFLRFVFWYVFLFWSFTSAKRERKSVGLNRHNCSLVIAICIAYIPFVVAYVSIYLPGVVDRFPLFASNVRCSMKHNVGLEMSTRNPNMGSHLI